MGGKSKAIGIDLGTTYSCVAVFENGTVIPIANDQGHRTTPSIVAFTNEGRLIGDEAKPQAAQNHANTVFGVKRLIGRRFQDVQLQSGIQGRPFDVVCDGDKPKIAVTYMNDKKTFFPEEISAMVLTKMKQTAEDYLECEVTDAVITVPAYFNDSQRKATIDAGTIAGLNVLQLINEPTAAALAYGMNQRVGSWRKILVFDLGGGTFDVSIMTVAKDKFKVEAVAGDTYLGGDDVDERLLMHLVDEIKCKFDKDISSDKKALSQLRTACEEAKRHLSFNKIANIHMAGFIDGKDYITKVSQSLFEEINKDLFMKTIQTVEKALSDAEMAKSDIHDVVLVGGSTRIPKIRALLEEFFDGKKLCKGINPDEAVAHGAAVQAAILMGDKSESIRNVHLYDVTPLSLGIAVLGGSTSVVIVRNTTIPIQETKRYITSADNQVVVSIDVYEGERTMVNNNNFLGKFLLKGLPPAPKGHVKLDVTFDIDINGTLTVSAVETSRCIKDSITITNDQGRLSKDDVTRMIQEAVKYKEEDEKLKQIGLNKVKLEEYVGIIKSKIASSSMDNISETDKKKILDHCDNIYKWLAEEEPRKAQDYVNKQLELEYIWNPIQKKMTQ